MQTVFVGLSGGVDSAVSAHLLKKQGYRVVGVFLKVWEPDFLPCTSGEDRLDAMRVAAHLNIPFLSYDFSEEYQRDVVDYFVSEYRAGRTPNPDVMCNRAIKFGAFWERAKKDGADFIATGHYAQKKAARNEHSAMSSELIAESWMLHRGVDATKDQSYFLWTLTQDDLSHTLFPVGGLRKSEVRKIADEAGLPNAVKKDSQGLCFLGHVAMKEFLEHYIPKTPGVIRDEEGRAVGTHDGVQFYTLGERASVARGEKLFIVKKNVETNELVVAPTVHSQEELRSCVIQTPHWIRGVEPKTTTLVAETRYHGTPLRVTVSGKTVNFEKPVTVASGQSIVFYDAETNECLGGAVAE